MPYDKNYFLARANKDNARGCWEWTRVVNKGGYGLVGGGKAGGTFYVHRMAFLLWRGDPRHLCVLHRCDNRRCFNPEHLFLGTRADNIRDAVLKGRMTGPQNPASQKGELNNNCKLTLKKVAAIRRSALTTRKLAKMYRVSATLVSLIKRRICWR